MATKASEYTNNIVGMPSTKGVRVVGQGINMRRMKVAQPKKSSGQDKMKGR